MRSPSRWVSLAGPDVKPIADCPNDAYGVRLNGFNGFCCRRRNSAAASPYQSKPSAALGARKGAIPCSISSIQFRGLHALAGWQRTFFFLCTVLDVPLGGPYQSAILVEFHHHEDPAAFSTPDRGHG
jgi:hypothetical protein